MFSHYAKSALMQIQRHRVVAAINIIGFSLGLAACLTLMIYVKSELSWDRSWKETKNTFLATMYLERPGRGATHHSFTDGPLKPRLLASVDPQTDHVSRLFIAGELLTGAHKGTSITAGYAEANFFEVLSPQVLWGPDTPDLKNPADIWLAKSTALKLFGRVDARGETVAFNAGRSLTVVGVFEDIPGQSHVSFDALLQLQASDTGFPFDTLDEGDGWNAYLTYVRLEDPSRVGIATSLASERYIEEEGLFRPQLEDPVQLINVQDLHTTGGLTGFSVSVDIRMLMVFSLLAVIILLIASLNFMNMSVVRITARARETAMRRVLGAGAGSLINQFLIETSLYILASLVLALAIVELAMPSLSALVNVELSLTALDDAAFLGLVAGLLITAVLMSGMYPAVLSARLRPAETLSSGRTMPLFVMRLSQIILVIQFTAAIVLISLTGLLKVQMAHLRSFDRGFDRENVMVLSYMGNPLVAPSRETFKRRLLQLPQFEAAEFSWTLPGYAGRSVFTTNVVNGVEVDEQAFTGRYVGPDYFDVLKINFLSGRRFTPNSQEEIRAERSDPEIDPVTYRAGTVIISRSAAKQMGFETVDAALEGTVTLGGGTVRVIGVVEDVFVDAAEIGSEPTAYLYDPSDYKLLNARFVGGAEAARAAAKTLWEEMYPDVPFRLSYLDERINQRYADQDLSANLLSLFAGLAVVVSLMGLFGMSAFHAIRKEKEVSLRKLFGARIAQIIGRLSWQFTRPVMVASLIAWPLIYIWGDRWLSSFSERIDFSTAIFVVPSILTLLLALTTVSVHAIRVARAAPIGALRHE